MVPSIPTGEMFFREGDLCSNFLLVIEGSVRVQKLSESGREIVLYRVEDGQSCILTTVCMLGGKRYSAEAVTESAVAAVALPHAVFQRAMHGSQGFREFVFSAYADRVSELLMLIDAISFVRIDQRLAEHLLELSADNGEMRLTHHLRVVVGAALVAATALGMIPVWGYVGIIPLATGLPALSAHRL